MRYERVHVIWDLYDGVRNGIADLDGAPHYFASQFDESADDYSDNFKLYPRWARIHATRDAQLGHLSGLGAPISYGEADLKTHPGHGRINAEYDELKSWLDDRVMHLQALPSLYKAKFRELTDQEELPGAMLREMEVVWSPSASLMS